METLLARGRTAVRIGAAALIVAAAAACNLNISSGVVATDQWKRSYTLAEGGTLEIHNSNGKIRVEPGDGKTIEVVADRLVKGPNDEAAKSALQKFTIGETTASDRVSLDGRNKGGVTFNMSYRVDFAVRVPRGVNVSLDATNGDITIDRLAGTVKVETTNGRIKGTALENNAQVSATNGEIELDFARLGTDGVRCETTNGAIFVTVPKDAKASVSLRVSNGGISTSGLDMAVSEQSRRRVDGTIGGGGPNIKLETTNGAISLKGK